MTEVRRFQAVGHHAASTDSERKLGPQENTTTRKCGSYDALQLRSPDVSRSSRPVATNLQQIQTIRG